MQCAQTRPDRTIIRCYFKIDNGRWWQAGKKRKSRRLQARALSFSSWCPQPQMRLSICLQGKNIVSWVKKECADAYCTYTHTSDTMACSADFKGKCETRAPTAKQAHIFLISVDAAYLCLKQHKVRRRLRADLCGYRSFAWMCREWLHSQWELGIHSAARQITVYCHSGEAIPCWDVWK